MLPSRREWIAEHTPDLGTMVSVEQSQESSKDFAPNENQQLSTAGMKSPRCFVIFHIRIQVLV